MTFLDQLLDAQSVRMLKEAEKTICAVLTRRGLRAATVYAAGQEVTIVVTDEWEGEIMIYLAENRGELEDETYRKVCLELAREVGT